MKRPVITTALLVVLAGCGEDLGGAPNAEGLNLPDAHRQLKQAGFSSSVTSGALFGVIVESNYTVCKEHSPNGRLVPLEVSKQC